MSGGQMLASAVGILLCGALLAVVLRGWRPELALCLSLAAGVMVMVLLMGQVAPLVRSIQRLVTAGGFQNTHLEAVMKATGICLVTQLTADTCRDAGESALAGKAELVGRVLLLLLTVPLFEEVLSLVTALIQGQAVGG